MVRNEGDRLRRVIVSAPRREYFLVRDPAAHNIKDVANRKQATAQHGQLCEVLRRSGAQVINVKELSGHPNSVFVRDAALVTPEGYIRLRMGLPTRGGEDEWMAEILESLGLPCAGEVETPGTVEGGDVILAGDVAFLGISGRSNPSGTRQLSRLLQGMGYETRTISLPAPHLHIGGAMSVVGPNAVLCCRGLFPRSFFDGFEVISISCDDATSANVIALGDREVIVETSCAAAAKALLKAGFLVHHLDLSEFIKGRGGPTCLILPVERTSSLRSKRNQPPKRKSSRSKHNI